MAAAVAAAPATRPLPLPPLLRQRNSSGWTRPAWPGQRQPSLLSGGVAPLRARLDADAPRPKRTPAPGAPGPAPGSPGPRQRSRHSGPRPPAPAVVILRRELRWTEPPWQLVYSTTLRALGLPQLDGAGVALPQPQQQQQQQQQQAPAQRPDTEEPSPAAASNGPDATAAPPPPPPPPPPPSSPRRAASSPVTVSLRVEPAGGDINFLVTGEIAATVRRPCDLCTEAFDEAVEAPLRVFLSGMGPAGGRVAGGGGTSGDGPGAWEIPFAPAAASCDLTDVVRDALEFGVPTRARCGAAACAEGRVFVAGPAAEGAGAAAGAAKRGMAAASGGAARPGAAAGDPRWAVLQALRAKAALLPPGAEPHS